MYVENEAKYHEAGFDAYITGFIFAKIKQLEGDLSAFKNILFLFRNNYQINLSNEDLAINQDYFVLEVKDKDNQATLNEINEEIRNKKCSSTTARIYVNNGNYIYIESKNQEIKTYCSQFGNVFNHTEFEAHR